MTLFTPEEATLYEELSQVLACLEEADTIITRVTKEGAGLRLVWNEGYNAIYEGVLVQRNYLIDAERQRRDARTTGR